MILLTGSTGYLGSQIARELMWRGAPFRVLVRDPSRMEREIRNWKPQIRNSKLDTRPSASPCEVAVGDIRDRESLKKSLTDVDRIIHTAALVKMWVCDRRDFWRVNVNGLQLLLRAAEEARVERVVYTSSFIALGPSPDTTAGEGLRHRGPCSNEYQESKAQALEWLREEGFQRFPVVALLPGVIYGPGPSTEGNLVGGMIDQYLVGKFPGLLGSGEQRWSFAFNADVVAAHLAALEAGKPGEEYVLGGDNRSLNEFFRLLARVSGVHHPVRHLPFWAGKVMGVVEVARARLFGHQPQITPGVAEIFRHDWVYSSSKSVRELAYRVTPLEEGLTKTLSVARDSSSHAGINNRTTPT